ncbi:MAG: chemotaxis protein CheW [Planctomycetota bacterium]
MSRAPRVLELVAAGERFGIEVGSIKALDRVRRHARLPGAPSYVLGVVEVRGEAVALIHLAARLGLPAAPVRAEQPLIVIESEEPVAIAVDQLLGVVEVAPEALSEGDSGAHLRPSSAVLGSSAGLRVLDPEAIVDGRALDPLPPSPQ